MVVISRPFKVRAEKAKNTALKLLQEKGIQAPPVPTKKILRELGKLFYFYISQCTDFAEEEAFSICKNGMYYIYINDDLPNGRDNFTYAHEIAHIVLQHHQEFDVDNLTDHERWILDREADIFAANFLMPEDWVRKRIEGKCYISVPEIGLLKDIFAVSWEAMIYRLDELEIQSKMVAYRTFANRRIVKKRNQKFLECPKCGNTDIARDALFCKICGMYLFNDCTSLDCGKHNDLNARYCIYCGAETTLFRSGVLKAWDQNQEAKKGITARSIPENRKQHRIIETALKGGFDDH